MISRIKQLLDRVLDWLDVSKVGLILLAFAAVGILLGNRDQNLSEVKIFDLLLDFYANFSAELAGIGITVLIIDRLYRHHEAREEKRRLIRQVSSTDERMAFEAVERLRAMGWLEDGALRGASLQAARMSKANLQAADIKFADLQRAQLSGTDLEGARLEGTNLRKANLSGANLQGSYLEGAVLGGADLSLVNLDGAQNLRTSQLIEVANLVHATMSDGNRYDGRFNLAGDVAQAHLEGYSIRDYTAMARFYDVSLEAYKSGQEWAQKRLPALGAASSVLLRGQDRQAEQMPTN